MSKPPFPSSPERAAKELPSNLFERHPGKTILVISLLALLLLVAATEIALRCAGYGPGRLSYGPVDHLIVYDTFFTDASGIFKANPRSQSWQPPFAINRDGFRSPDFAAPRDQRPAILLLGDSFAWGATASPITASFADLLRDAGYTVYNTGIPGVNPTQFEALARLYVPRLHPDVVIVAFFMGHDLVEKPDPMLPNHNFFYVTNAGWITGFDEQNRPLSAEEAYRHYIDTPKQRLKFLLSQTAIGTWMYNLVPRLRQLRRPPEKTAGGSAPGGERRSARPPWEKYRYTIDCLHRIQSLAQTSGSKFYLLVIPNLGQGCCSAFRVADYRPVFDQLQPIYLDGLDDHMYTPSPDCHFNNLGHRYAFEAILRTLKNSRN